MEKLSKDEERIIEVIQQKIDIASPVELSEGLDIVNKKLADLEKEKPTPQDAIANEIPCTCGNKDHKAGLIIGKWGSLEEGAIEDKVKIQIFEGDNIKTVVVNKGKLLEALK